MVTRFNLVPADRLDTVRRRSCLRGWIMAGGSYVAFLGLTFLVAQVVLLSDDRVVRDELDRLVGRVQYGESQVSEIKAELQTVRERTTANKLIAGQPDWGVLLAILGRSLDDELVLTTCVIERSELKGAKPGSSGEGSSPPSLYLELAGLGRTQGAVSQFVLRLEERDMFEDVTLVNTRREPFRSEFAVGFLIRCRLRAVDDAGDKGP